MSTAALEAKNKGNDAFAKKNYEEAIKHFTDAINLDPNNHLLYSNRSAAYASLNKYQEALADADKTVSIKPDWAKGYSRMGAAHFGLRKYDEAIKAYEKGLKIEPNNDLLKQGLVDVKQALEEKSGGQMDIGQLFGEVFKGDVWTKIRLHPNLRNFLNEPDYVAMVTDAVNNPSNVMKYLSDKRFMSTISVLMGIPNQPSDFPEPAQKKPEPEKPQETKKEEKKEEPKKADPMEVETSPEKKKAEDEKNKGNDAYKAKNFDLAIQHYTNAMEADPKNIVYVTNRAAAYFEKGSYAESIKDCQTAIDEGRQQFADYKQIAKAYTRMGNAYMKLEKYTEAIDAYTHSLTEDRNSQTLALLQKAEKIKEETERKSYIDPAKALEAKQRGNDFFSQSKFPEAIAEYTEAIKRNPEDHVLYSNRAACYMKLFEYQMALKDVDESIKRNNKFVKAWTRKGHIHFFLKEYGKALEAYDQGLKLEEGNQEIKEGIDRTMKAMSGSQANQSDSERLENAMKDPEVVEILSDPVMRKILEDMQSDPKAAQDHLKSPVVMQKIQKLVNAGVLKVGGMPR